MAIPNPEYWAQRTKRMENALQNKSLDYANNLETQFNNAVKEIDNKIRAWYQRFAVNNKISFSEAQKLLTKGELKEFKWTVWEYIEKAKESAVSGEWAKELENASARVHISRLEALKIQLRQQAEELAGVRIAVTKKAAENAYIGSYYHTAFEIQKGLGVGCTMEALNKNAVEKILSRPWTTDNRTFTARCWTDKNKLVQLVNQELTRMAVTGAPPDKAIKTIAKQLNVSARDAARVVMTESAAFASAAQRDCFNDLDVEQYQIVGTFDKKKTCNLCSDLNGKVFPMSEFREGETAPPFHPWCRCCTAPYFADMEGMGKRWSRNPDTGKGELLPADTKFSDWKARYVKPKKDLTKGGESGTIKGRKASTLSSDGKTKQYAHKIGSIDISDQSAVDQLVKNFENRYTESELEHCLIIRPNGEVYVARGDKRSVNTSDLMGDKMLGSFTSHNHPKDVTQYSFSEEDFLSTLSESGKRMRAFDFKYEYEAVFPDKSISKDELFDAYALAKKKRNDLLEEAGLGFDDYEENVQHFTVAEMCRLLGINYTRRKR